MKKFFLFPLLLLCLSVLFAIISILYILLKNNKWLLSKKILIGALILNLSSFYSFANGDHPDIEVTCYEVAVISNYVQIDERIITLSDSNTINLTIEYMQGIKAIFSLIDDNGILVFSKTIEKDNSESDWLIPFTIILPENISPGNYLLKIHTVSDENETPIDCNRDTFSIIIKE